MTKTVEQNWEAIYTVAQNEAAKAQREYIQKYGEPMYCGFAWVNVPGTHPFTKWLKRTHPRAGHNGHPKGWEIWAPGLYNGQSMDIKEIGARAFADVLEKHGITCYVGSRAD